jgi:hypothetical protein
MAKSSGSGGRNAVAKVSSMSQSEFDAFDRELTRKVYSGQVSPKSTLVKARNARLQNYLTAQRKSYENYMKKNPGYTGDLYSFIKNTYG